MSRDTQSVEGSVPCLDQKEKDTPFFKGSENIVRHTMNKQSAYEAAQYTAEYFTMQKKHQVPLNRIMMSEDEENPAIGDGGVHKDSSNIPPSSEIKRTWYSGLLGHVSMYGIDTVFQLLYSPSSINGPS